MTPNESREIVVHVRYFNVLADYAGTKRAEVTVPTGISLRVFLNHLIESGPEPFRRALSRGEMLNSYLRVFLNERVVAAEGFDVPLADGDEVLLFPAVAGGETRGTNLKFVLQIDPAQCTDCRLCEIFCSLKQEGYVNPNLARIRIRHDQSRKLLAPITCPPCDEKKCIAVCPEPGALTISPQTGAVVVVEALCTGCSKCIAACDIGAIRFLRQDGRGKNGKAVALKCNQCDGDPACVRVCEPKALEYVEDRVIAGSGLRDEATLAPHASAGVPNSQVGDCFAPLAMTQGQQVFERLGALLVEIEKDWTQRGGQPRRRMQSR
jgi:anaerobic carbon-monoxide dehydrogenase iron sulfur subunit